MEKLKSDILNNTKSIKKRLNIFPKKFIKELLKLSYNNDIKVIIQNEKYKISELPNILMINHKKLIKSSKPTSYNDILKTFINECKGKSENDISSIYKKYSKIINDKYEEDKKLLYFCLDSLKFINKEIKNKNININESCNDIITEIDLFISESENLNDDEKIKNSKKEIKKLIKIAITIVIISLSLIVFIKHHSDKNKIKNIEKIEDIIKNKEKEIKNCEKRLIGANFISEEELKSIKAKIIQTTGELSSYKDTLEEMKYTIMMNSSSKYTREQLKKQKDIVKNRRKNDENIYINNILNYKNESEENDMNIDKMIDQVINESANIYDDISDSNNYTFENVRDIFYEASGINLISVEERESLINEARDAYIMEAEASANSDTEKQRKAARRKTIMKIGALLLAVTAAIVVAKKVISAKLKENKKNKEIEALNNQLNNLTKTSRLLNERFKELKRLYKNNESEEAYKEMLKLNSELVIIQGNIKSVCVKLNKGDTYKNENSALDAAINRLSTIKSANDYKVDRSSDNNRIKNKMKNKVNKEIEKDKKYYNSMKKNKKKYREFYTSITGEEMDESVSIDELFTGLEEMITEMYINNELSIEEATTIMSETEASVMTDDVMQILEAEDVPPVSEMQQEIIEKRTKTIKMIKRTLIIIAATIALIIATKKIISVVNNTVDKKIQSEVNKKMEKNINPKNLSILDKEELKLSNIEKELNNYLNRLVNADPSFTHNDMKKTEELCREAYSTRDSIINLNKKMNKEYKAKSNRNMNIAKAHMQSNVLANFDQYVGPNIWNSSYYQDNQKFYDKSCALVADLYDDYDYMSEAFYTVKKVKLDKVKQSLVYANTIYSLTKSIKHFGKDKLDRETSKSLDVFNSIASSASRVFKKYINNIDEAPDAQIKEVTNYMSQINKIRNKLRTLAVSKLKIDISKIDSIEKQKLEKIKKDLSKDKTNKNIKNNLKSIAVKESVYEMTNREIYDKIVSALYEQCDYGEITIQEREECVNEAKDIFLSEGFDIRNFWTNSDTAVNPYANISEKESIKLRKKINLPEYIKNVSYASHRIKLNNGINETKKYLLLANKSLIKSIGEINKLPVEKICGIVPWLTKDVLNCINTYSHFATNIQNQIVKNKIKAGDYDNFVDVQKMKEIENYNTNLTKSLINIQRFNDWKLTENMMKKHKSVIVAALALLSDYTLELSDNLVKLPADIIDLFNGVNIFLDN